MPLLTYRSTFIITSNSGKYQIYAASPALQGTRKFITLGHGTHKGCRYISCDPTASTSLAQTHQGNRKGPPNHSPPPLPLPSYGSRTSTFVCSGELLV